MKTKYIRKHKRNFSIIAIAMIFVKDLTVEKSRIRRVDLKDISSTHLLTFLKSFLAWIPDLWTAEIVLVGKGEDSNAHI